ncbi:unnamed protein product [Dovyalis caffra]|uniref:Glycine-rich protein n=1 Tax=Dovyalis caffra TaxID=77055 RepID=A0AAV1S439_9ROSI|nr:unnamed protein product [Dovyalis caffra]
MTFSLGFVLEKGRRVSPYNLRESNCKTRTRGVVIVEQYASKGSAIMGDSSNSGGGEGNVRSGCHDKRNVGSGDDGKGNIGGGYHSEGNVGGGGGGVEDNVDNDGVVEGNVAVMVMVRPINHGEGNVSGGYGVDNPGNDDDNIEIAEKDIEEENYLVDLASKGKKGVVQGQSRDSDI